MITWIAIRKSLSIFGPNIEIDPDSGRTRLALFAALAAIITVLLASGLDQPPVWDTTSGLFTPAITLAENDFDLVDLLSRPGWSKGGPNIHAFSIVTWITGLALRVLGDGAPLLVTLHALHFCAGAATLVGLFRLAAPLLDPRLALGLVGTVMLFPLFQVQIGYLYTEIPLALCTVWSLREAAVRRWTHTVLWSALACSVKESGIVVPVALAVAALLERAPVAARARRVVALSVAPLFFGSLHTVVGVPLETGWGFEAPPYFVQLAEMWRKLTMLPDWLAILGVYAVIVLLSLKPLWCSIRSRPTEADLAARTRMLLALTVGAFFGLYLTIPLTGVEVYVLPRYYVQIVPLVLLGTIDAVYRLGRARAHPSNPPPSLREGLGEGAAPRAILRRPVARAIWPLISGRLPASATALTLAVLSLWFVLNRNGSFAGVYPPVPYNEFSLAERTFEYRELLAAQRQMIAAAVALPPTIPVFYGLPEHFLFQYPRLGYVPAPLAEGHCIWLEEWSRDARLEEFPDHFVILYNFSGFGGDRLREVIDQAKQNRDRHVQHRIFQVGRYRTFLFEVR